MSETENENFKKVFDILNVMNERFDKIDEKFDKIDKKFDKIDEKFDKIDKKFDKIDKKIDNLQDDMKRVKRTCFKVENELIPNVQILLENHCDIAKKVIVANDIQERLQVVEFEMKIVKKMLDVKIS